MQVSSFPESGSLAGAAGAVSPSASNNGSTRGVRLCLLLCIENGRGHSMMLKEFFWDHSCFIVGFENRMHAGGERFGGLTSPKSRRGSLGAAAGSMHEPLLPDRHGRGRSMDGARWG